MQTYIIKLYNRSLLDIFITTDAPPDVAQTGFVITLDTYTQLTLESVC